jgi:hypothetical protein
LLLWLLLQEPGDEPVWRQLQLWLDAAVETDDDEVMQEADSDAEFHSALNSDDGVMDSSVIEGDD